MLRIFVQCLFVLHIHGDSDDDDDGHLTNSEYKKKKVSGGWERGSKDDWRRPSKIDRTLRINVVVVLLSSPLSHIHILLRVGTSALFTPAGHSQQITLICFFLPPLSPFAQLSLLILKRMYLFWAFCFPFISSLAI